MCNDIQLFQDVGVECVVSIRYSNRRRLYTDVLICHIDTFCVIVDEDI